MCGDWNSHYPPDSVDTPLSMLVDAVPGLSDVHGGEDFPTYHEGFDGDVLPPGAASATTEHSHRLDYIFARVPEGFPLRLTRGEVHHPRYVGDDGRDYRPSDHEPISATFVVSGETSGFFQ